MTNLAGSRCFARIRKNILILTKPRANAQRVVKSVVIPTPQLDRVLVVKEQRRKRIPSIKLKQPFDPGIDVLIILYFVLKHFSLRMRVMYALTFSVGLTLKSMMRELIDLVHSAM